jgi:hypothetical protein
MLRIITKNTMQGMGAFGRRRFSTIDHVLAIAIVTLATIGRSYGALAGDRQRGIRCKPSRKSVHRRRSRWEEQGGSEMMRDMMTPDMMWGMGVFGLIGAVVLVLVVAALVKYLFFR